MARTISRDELKEKVDRDDNFLLVETLPATAYHHNHLPRAINLPPESITSLASQILPDKNAEIVVYCASPTWHASENAARELAALGYTNVRDYAEGKQDWIDAGLPLESDHTHWDAIFRDISLVPPMDAGPIPEPVRAPSNVLDSGLYSRVYNPLMTQSGIQIGDLAKRAGVTVDTVRFYERRRLLSPAPRSGGGFRLFGPDVVERIRFIKQAQEFCEMVWDYYWQGSCKDLSAGEKSALHAMQIACGFL